jgi:hypothetical protein
MGLRVLKQWRAQTRRKLYHFGEHQAVFIPNAPLVHPHNSMIQRERYTPLSALEKVLENHATPKRKLQCGELPQELRNRMKKCSDPHVRLDLMLDYKSPLRVSKNNLEYLVHKEFNVGLDEVIDVVGERSLIKMMKFYLIHKDFDSAGSLIHHLVMNRFQDLQVISKLNAALFETLKKDHDLSLGIYDIFKSLYTHCDGDIKLFKFCFTSLTNNGETLRQFHLPHTMFLDILKIVQLEIVIHSCDDVTILPKQYWTTGYKYIDTALSMKLIHNGQLVKAWEHMNNSGIPDIDGVFYRALQNAHSKEEVTLELLPNLTRLGSFDKDLWRKLDAKHTFFKQCFKRMPSSPLKHELESIYLAKLIKTRKLLTARQFTTYNLNHITHWEMSTLVSLVLITKDGQLYRQITGKLTPSTRSVFLDLALLRTMAELRKSKEPMSPEQQLSHYDRLLQGVHYRLTDRNLITLGSFLGSLPYYHRMKLIDRIKGPSSFGYIALIKRCKTVCMVSGLLPYFKTREERYTLCNVLLKDFSLDDIIKLLHNIPSEAYNSLHPKLTSSILETGDLSKVKQLLKYCPHPPSQHLFTDHIALHSPSSLHTIKPTSSLHTRQIETYSRLMDMSKLYMDKPLRKSLKSLKRSMVHQRPLALMVLKQAVQRSKSCGEIVMNERLKWAMSQCLKYGVPKDVIEGIVM